MTSLPPVTLVLGGVRSGKSQYAEDLIEAQGHGLYIATGEANDDEMHERIELHKARRGGNWLTIEEPIELAREIARHAASHRPILADCLTLWLSNLYDDGRDPIYATETLIETLDGLDGSVVFVSSEIGLGGVAQTPLGRCYADELGAMNQAIAARADRVVLVAAGLPLILKDETK